MVVLLTTGWAEVAEIPYEYVAAIMFIMICLRITTLRRLQNYLTDTDSLGRLNLIRYAYLPVFWGGFETTLLRTGCQIFTPGRLTRAPPG